MKMLGVIIRFLIHYDFLTNHFCIRFSQSKSVTKEADGTLTYETTAGVFKGFDCVLFAIGREPNTALALDKAVSYP